MSIEEKKIVVGRFGKTHGLKGWLRVNSETKPEQNILNYQPWYLVCDNNSHGKFKSLNITGSTFKNNTLLVHIEGYDTLEAAKQLAGFFIFVDHVQLPTLSDQHYYWVDLEGLAVFTTQNELIGVVDYLMEAGACDVMVIKGDQKEVLVPFDKQNVIKQVDLESGKIVVDWDPEF